MPTIELPRIDDRMIGRRVQLARKNLGLSLLDVCEALETDCCCEILESMELGREEISAVQIKQLSLFFDLSVEYFLHDEPVMDCDGAWRILRLYAALHPRQQAYISVLMDDIVSGVAISRPHQL